MTTSAASLGDESVRPQGCAQPVDVRERHERDPDDLRQGPPDGRGEARHPAVARVAAQDHLEQLRPQPHLLTGPLGLLLRIALRARRGQLVDVGEERLAEREQRVGRHLRHVHRA